ncbi:hypothetical protein CR513_52017, partial [Mucuna pruriens]
MELLTNSPLYIWVIRSFKGSNKDETKKGMKKRKRKKKRENQERIKSEHENLLISRKKHLFCLPTNMCFVVNTPLANLPTGSEKMLEGLKEIPHCLFGHQINFTPRATMTSTNSDDIFLSYAHPSHPLHMFEYDQLDVPSFVRVNNSMHYLHVNEHQDNIVIFLGYVIDSRGVKINVKKVKATQGWPIPKYMRNVRSFYGIARFYKHYVKNFKGGINLEGLWATKAEGGGVNKEEAVKGGEGGGEVGGDDEALGFKFCAAERRRHKDKRVFTKENGNKWRETMKGVRKKTKDERLERNMKNWVTKNPQFNLIKDLDHCVVYWVLIVVLDPKFVKPSEKDPKFSH